MKEKIKKICLILAQLIGLFLVFLVARHFYQVIMGYKYFDSDCLPFLVVGILLLTYPKLIPHFKNFIRWAWGKENLYKLAIIIVAISVLIIAVSFIQ